MDATGRTNAPEVDPVLRSIIGRWPVLLAAWLLVTMLGAWSWGPRAYWPDAGGYAESVSGGRWVAHPPGYLLFVASGRLLHAWGVEAFQALQMISFGAWSFSLPAMFSALRRLCPVGPAAGLTLGFGLSWIPLVISHSGTSHAVDLLLITLLLGVVVRPSFQEGDAGMAALFWGILGVAAGFRLTTLIMFFPLAGLVLWRQRRSGWHWLGCGLLGLWVAGLYLLTIHLSGGWEAYSAYARGLAESARPSSLFLNGLTGPVLMNIFRSLLWFGSAAGLILLPLAGCIWGQRKNGLAWHLVAAIAGPLGVTTLYLATHPGYLVPALPGVFFLAALARVRSGRPPARFSVVIVMISVALSLSWFFGGRIIRTPSGKADAAWNALVLQYSMDGVCSGTFQTLSGWLVTAGETGAVPAKRLQELHEEAEREKKRTFHH